VVSSDIPSASQGHRVDLRRSGLLADLFRITSDAEIVRPNHDLTCQLMARKERLSWLIKFINDNGALGKVSVTSFICFGTMFRQGVKNHLHVRFQTIGTLINHT
jgi:hypothetical protein